MSSILLLNSQTSYYLQPIVESKKIDATLITGAAILVIFGVLSSLEIFHGISTTNAVYLSFGMFGASALFLILEMIKLGVKCLEKPIDKFTLNNQFICLDSEEGKGRLERSSTLTHTSIKNHYEPQLNNYCGVASSVIVLNALDILDEKGCPFTQQTFFTKSVEETISKETASRRGVSLEELVKALNSFPQIKAEGLSGDRFDSPQDLAQALKQWMGANNTYVIANFSRTGLGQKGGGHHSPIQAFDEVSQSVLIADVNIEYGFYWANLTGFWQSMQNLKDKRNAPRGLIVCKKNV